MRTPKQYVAKDGTETWKVRFRYNGRQTSESFDGEKKGVVPAEATLFAKEIDLLGVADALKRLQERSGGAVDTHGQTVDDLWDKFIVVKDGEVKSDRSTADYRRDYRRWIQPVFGTLLAETVDERLVQSWVTTMRTGKDWIRGDGKKPSLLPGKLAGKTVQDRHALLSALFTWAMHPGRGYVSRNPCIGSELPRRGKGAPKGLWPAEWQALAPALEQTNKDGFEFCEFLLASGWRYSEGAALHSQSVEDYGDEMYVSMNQVVRRNAKSQHVIVADGKSDDSYDRRIKIDAEAAAMVRRRIDKLGGSGLVFTTAGGSKWHYSNFLERIWNPAVELAKLSRRPTPHWLRHTHVGWLIIGRKTNLVEIQRRVGHASLDTTTRVYGKMIDDISDDALDGFAQFRKSALEQKVPKPEIMPGHQPPAVTLANYARHSAPELEAGDSPKPYRSGGPRLEVCLHCNQRIVREAGGWMDVEAREHAEVCALNADGHEPEAGALARRASSEPE